MRRFLGIGEKLTLAFAALAGVTVLVVGFGFVVGRHVIEDIQEAEAARLPAARATAEAQATLLRMQLHVRGYLVLGDRRDVHEYDAESRAFAASLLRLQSLSREWAAEDAHQIASLGQKYAQWKQLPPRLFDLHDDPLKNQPALRLARLEVQPRRVQVLVRADELIADLRNRDAGSGKADLLKDLLAFQTSFDAMVTNLMAYAASGEVNFKYAYGPQLSINAAQWHDIYGRRGTLVPAQRERVDEIAARRSEIGGLALQIIAIVTGERAYGDRYLYRTEVEPGAEEMLNLLQTLADRQGRWLQGDLARIQSWLQASGYLIALFGIAAVMLAIALVLFSFRAIVRPVRALTAVADQVAGLDGLPLPRGTGHVDELKQLTQTLTTRLRKNDLQRLMSAISDAVWSAEIDSTGALVYVYLSPVVERIAGLPPEAFLGLPGRWLEIVHPDDRRLVDSTMRRMSPGGDERIEIEYQVLRPDGTLRWVHDKVQATSTGGRTMLNGVISDITERKTAEGEVQRLERQLRHAQKLEAIGTLAGGIAHDFNNILGAILGYGERALRGVPEGSRLQRDIDSMLAAGERGRSLVDRILAFSRSGIGERTLVHVQQVVDEVLDLVEAGLPDGVRLERRLHAGAAATLGEPTQIHQVLMNLAMNAVQAMPQGGVLFVSLEIARARGPHAVTTGYLDLADYITLTVSDSGIGMTAATIERIFDPFFTTKDVGVGTGLGLSLVHGIVGEMHGAVDVTSEPGRGSVFTVYLPHNGVALRERAALDPALPRGHGQRVMVVDDDESLLDLASDNLSLLGYAPEAFTSSVKALEAFRSRPSDFDAIITDERMPAMSGRAFIDRLREIRRDIPVLLVSGYVGADADDWAFNSQADYFVKKPVMQADLAHALKQILGSASVSEFRRPSR